MKEPLSFEARTEAHETEPDNGFRTFMPGDAIVELYLRDENGKVWHLWAKNPTLTECAAPSRIAA